MASTSSERSLQAKAAATTRWAKATDREAETTSARNAFLAKLEREVDPEGVLPPEIRLQRAVELRKAHLLRASLKSAQVRRQRREALQASESAPESDAEPHVRAFKVVKAEPESQELPQSFTVVHKPLPPAVARSIAIEGELARNLEAHRTAVARQVHDLRGDCR